MMGYSERKCEACPTVFLPTSGRQIFCNDCGHRRQLERNKVWQKKFFAENPEKRSEYMRRWYGNHRKDALSAQKVRDDKPRRKKQKALACQRWAKKHPGRACIKVARRRARKLNAIGSHTDAEWEEIKERFHHRCGRCRKKRKLTRDHIVALSNFGSDDAGNIQPLCRSCNSWKGARTVRYDPSFV